MTRSPSPPDAAEPPHAVLSVSQLTAQIQELVEGAFPSVWIAGEISNFARPRSGHCYFTLKDDAAQIRAVIWRGVASRIPFELGDGLEIVCHGSLDVYPPRGSYQFVIDQLQPQGVGALELALRKLREKLSAEGLFDRRRKRPLPRFPRRIALVTSPTGAAIRDFLEVLRRRWRGADVLVVPAAVQGKKAAAEIAAGIATVNRLKMPVDVLVVGRGGGSLEDLWAFNEELVVRAICASRVPVVSAVGHEIDVTLSDLAADVRALTPSEAAELVVPAEDDLRSRLLAVERQLSATLQNRVSTCRERLATIVRRRVLQRPAEIVHDEARRVDDLSLRLGRAGKTVPRRFREPLAALGGKLDTLSPLAVLGRGYSLTQRAPGGEILRDAAHVAAGDEISTRLARGRLVSRVERVELAHDG